MSSRLVEVPPRPAARDLYLTDDPTEAATLNDKAIAGCAADDVEEINSLGKTLSSWRSEIIAPHRTGTSNGPTEGLNLTCPLRRSAAAGPPHPRTSPAPAAAAATKREHGSLRRPAVSSGRGSAWGADGVRAQS